MLSLQNALFNWQKKIAFYFVKGPTNTNGIVEFYAHFTYTLGRKTKCDSLQEGASRSLSPKCSSPKIFRSRQL